MRPRWRRLQAASSSSSRAPPDLTSADCAVCERQLDCLTCKHAMFNMVAASTCSNQCWLAHSLSQQPQVPRHFVNGALRGRTNGQHGAAAWGHLRAACRAENSGTAAGHQQVPAAHWCTAACTKMHNSLHTASGPACIGMMPKPSPASCTTKVGSPCPEAAAASCRSSCSRCGKQRSSHVRQWRHRPAQSVSSCSCCRRAPHSSALSPQYLGGGGPQADFGLAAPLPVRQRRRLPQLVQPLNRTNRRVGALRADLQTLTAWQGRHQPHCGTEQQRAYAGGCQLTAEASTATAAARSSLQQLRAYLALAHLQLVVHHLWGTQTAAL